MSSVDDLKKRIVKRIENNYSPTATNSDAKKRAEKLLTYLPKDDLKVPQKPMPEEYGLNSSDLAKFNDSSNENFTGTSTSLGCLGSIIISASVPILFGISPFSPKGQFLSVIFFILVGFLLTGFLAKWIGGFLKSGLSNREKNKYERFQNDLEKFEDRMSELTTEYLNKLRSKKNYWRELTCTEFERELARKLEEQGFETSSTPKSGDQGIDLILDENTEDEVIVQCKAHKSKISPAKVRELYGSLNHSNASEAWLVTLEGFTSGSKEFAQDKAIKLLTIEDVISENY